MAGYNKELDIEHAEFTTKVSDNITVIAAVRQYSGGPMKIQFGHILGTWRKNGLPRLEAADLMKVADDCMAKALTFVNSRTEGKPQSVAETKKDIAPTVNRKKVAKPTKKITPQAPKKGARKTASAN